MPKIKLFSLLWSLLMLTSLVSATVYEDAEDGNTNGWRVYDSSPAGAQISNEYDSSKGSKVIRLQSTGTANGFILGGREWEPGKWADTSSTTIKWSMKFSESYVVYIRVMTTKGPRYIQYTARSISLGGSGQYVHLGLGASSRNGTWQTITRDLQADLAQFQPGNTITAINGLLIRGSGLVDDIEVKNKNSEIKLRPFTLRYTNNLKGNIKTIGNTVMTSSPSTTNGNGSSNMVYVDIDNNNATFNSSSADINPIESGVDISNARVKWAGLYWQGYLHTSDPYDGTNTNDQYTNLTTADSIRSIVNTHTVSFTTPTGTFSISPDVIDGIPSQGIGYTGIAYDKLSYSAFADVTNILSHNAIPGTYTVANIPTQQGKTSGRAWLTFRDSLGNYGAWALVVIYENNTSAAEKTRNFSVYDGLTVMAGKNNPTNPLNLNETITFSGFRTPKNAPNGVDSVITIFAGEGDARLSGRSIFNGEDSASITNKDGDTYMLPYPQGRNNYFSSAIFGVPNRNPRIDDNKGIDIHVHQIGTLGGSHNPISTNQTSASLTLSTVLDTYFPSMVAFSTELYTPKLCYDYSVRMGDHIKVPSKNNDINTSYWGDNPLVLKVFIHNLDSDFDLTHSRLKIHFSKQNKFQFLDPYATVSPPNINAYLPAVTTGSGEISIGENNSEEGGVIGANISLYAKMGYKVLKAESINNHFELEINTQIQFDPQAAPVSYNFTSAGDANNSNHIGLCPRDPVYHPVYERFNIERTDSKFTQATKVRYPLYTQVAGKAFDVSVASYGGEHFEDPLVVDNTSVDLELIDAGNFDNNSSAGYDNICEEPASVASSDTFVEFNNTSRVHVNLKKTLSNFNNDVALRSAAFRVWALTKKDSNTSSNKRLTVKHHCTDKSKESCFKTVYDTNYKDAEDAQLHFCASACGASPHGCYACLKKYFATPFCSRDNFSIRPESFRIAIADTNESTDANPTKRNILSQNSTTLVKSKLALATGYTYRWDINATLYKSNAFALGYYNNAFRAESNITDIAYIKYQRVVAPLLFADTAACTDKTHSTLGLKMQNGTLVGGQNFSHNNVGKYEMYMHDSNWTNVDQASYPYKTTFDNACRQNPSLLQCSDCSVNSTDVTPSKIKVGCDIDSDITNNDAYIKLPLTFHPYAFSINMPLIRRPNRSILFMNDLSDDYFGNVLSAQLSQATSFEGNLSALGKQGNVLSNFTNSCVASDVRLHMAHNMQVDEDAVPLQQYLEIGVDTKDHTEEKNATLTVPKSAFTDENKGQTTLQLHTTLKKPLGFGNRMNPVDVNYASLKATAPDENSSAYMQDDFVPEGKEAYNVNTTYVYGKVTPWQRLYKNIEKNSELTPIYVDIFCDEEPRCAEYGLTENSLGKEETENGWKRASIFNVNELGTTDIAVQYLAEKNAIPSINVNGITKTVAEDVNFDDDQAAQNDVNISVGSPERNSMIKVQFSPVPWLKYDNSIDYFRLHFVAPSAWAGVGKTGYVTNTSSSNTQNNRMNW